MPDVTVIRRHVAAVTRLLLGNRELGLGMNILGGQPVDLENQANLAKLALETGSDLIHLAFENDATGATVMTGIILCAPRAPGVYVYTHCRLFLGESAKRAVILPGAEIRSHFKLEPSELLQMAGVPKGSITHGAARATAQVQRLVDDGVDVARQMAVFDVGRQ